MDTEALKQLAAQYACPQGEKGVKVAEVMNVSNTGMYRNAIENLQLISGNHILELGHGNCGHLDMLLSQVTNLSYTGLEISPAMFEEAQKRMFRSEKTTSSFYLYDGTNIPFNDQTFDRILSVNTIFFWEKPQEMLQEIARVLKPEGKCCITFFDRDYMENMPFSKYSFRYLEKNEIEELVEQTSLIIDHIDQAADTVNYKSGQTIRRQFYTYIFTKKI